LFGTPLLYAAPCLAGQKITRYRRHSIFIGGSLSSPEAPEKDNGCTEGSRALRKCPSRRGFVKLLFHGDFFHDKIVLSMDRASKTVFYALYTMSMLEVRNEGTMIFCYYHVF